MKIQELYYDPSNTPDGPVVKTVNDFIARYLGSEYLERNANDIYEALTMFNYRDLYKLMDTLEDLTSVSMIEAVKIDSSPYVNAHGTNPRGNGTWSFVFYKDGKRAEVKNIDGPLLKAKNQATKYANSKKYDKAEILG